MPSIKGRCDIWKERASYLARLITIDPEVALKELKMRSLHITGYEVMDVSAISLGRGTMCGGERIAVWLERRRIPLRGQNFLQGFERVRVL